MPLTLDLATVLAFGAVLAAMAMLQLLATWHSVGRPAHLAAWTGFCGLSALSFTLHALRGHLPDAWLVFGATPVSALAWGLFWAGGRLLGGRPPAWPWLLLPPALWVLACLFPAVRAQIGLRVALACLLFGGLALLGAWELLRLRGSAGRRRTALALGLLTLLFGLGLILRVALGLGGMPGSFGGLLFVFGGLLPVAVGFAGPALAGIQVAEQDAERIAAAARREAAALQAGRDEVRRLHGALPALVFLREVAPDGGSRLTYRGGDAEAVTGWPAAALAPHVDLDHLNGPGSLPMAEFLRTVVREGSGLVDWQMIRPDGALQWVRTHGRCIALHPDGSAEVVGYILNVEAEYRAAAAAEAARAREAAALQEGRARLERLHAGLPALVFQRDVDPDGESRLLYRGGDVEAVTGWPAAALRDMPTLDHLEGSGAMPIAAIMRDVLRDGSASHDLQMRRPDGGFNWMRTRARLVSRRPDGGGEVVGYLLNVDAEVRAEAEVHAALRREAEALEAGRAEIARLHAALPAVLFHRDLGADGTSRLVYRGGDIEAVTGWPAGYLAEGDNLAQLAEGGAEVLLAFERQVLRDGAAVMDWRLRAPDGALRWMRSHARRLTLRPGGGELVGYVLDVSAEYAAAAAAEQARAREAEALLAGRAEVERLHGGLPAIVFHREVEPDGASRLIYRGGDYLTVTGWPAEAFPEGGDFSALLDPESTSFAEHLRLILRDGSASMDWRCLQPDGSFRWMRNFGRVLTRRPDGGGEVVGYVLDIHREREAAERAAAAAAVAADLDRTLGLAPVVVFRGRIAPDGGFTQTYLSRGIERLTGHSWARMNEGGLRGVLDQHQQQGEAELMQRLLSAGQLVQDLRMRHADGHWLWMRQTLAIVDRHPAGGGEMIAFLTDITAERAAQASLAHLDRAFAEAPVAVYRAAETAPGVFEPTYLSRGIEKLTGWLWSSFQRRPDALHALMEYASEADRAAALAPPEGGQVAVDMRLRCADGRRLWARHTVLHVPAAEGQPAGLLGFLTDITEEHAARTAVADLDRALAAAPVAVYRARLEPSGDYVRSYLSRGIEALTGWSWSEIAERPGALRGIMEFDSEEDRVSVRAAIRTGHAVHEVRLRCADGRRIWGRHTVLASPPDAVGGREVVGFIVDITAEREARERETAALQEGRAQIERLLTNLPAVLFHRVSGPDGRSRLLFRGGDVATVTGWPKEFLAATDDIATLKVGGPGSFDRVAGIALETGAVTVDWQMRQPDGRPPRWMRSHARQLSRHPDGGGEVVGYVLDVSVEYGAAAAAEAAREREAAALLAGRAEVERLLAGLPAVIFLRDVAPDGSSRLLYRTGDIGSVTGWPAEVANGQETWRHLAGPEAPDFPAVYRTALQSGEATVEWQLRRPDGSLQWMRSHGTRLSLRPDGSGEVAGYMLNIDRERSAEAELETVLRAAPLAVYRGRVTADGRFTRTYISRGIERLTGWPWEEVNPRGGLSRIVDPASREALPGRLAELLRDGTVRYDQRLLRADGGWADVHSTLTVLDRMADGSVDVVGFMADVTAERAAQAHAAAAGRLAALGEMGTGLAHELKQPLATISLAAENALRSVRRGDAAAALPRLERITEQVQRAASIIENLRRFARGGASGAPPEPVPVDRAVDSALMLVGGPLREAGIAVELALEQPVPVVLVQPVSLEQVLVNLLVNAADALRGQPPGTARRIRVAAVVEGALVRLTVADTGGGIPEAIIPRLFEPFVSTKDADQGTGLGLSICHGLVKAMGGSIEAHNAGEGAVFAILLPRAPAG